MSQGNATCETKYFHKESQQVTRKIRCDAMYGNTCKNEVVIDRYCT